MHGLIVAAGSDWSLAGSIMTFAIPVGLFVVVATTLYFLYTRPHTVPGHRDVVAASGRHAAGAAWPAAPQQPPAAQPPPPAQARPPAQPPPSAGGAPGSGGTPGSGGMPGPGPGQGRHDGREGME